MIDLVQRLRRCASGTRSDRMREFLVEVADYIEDLVAKERRRDGTIPRLEAELEHSKRVYRELVVTANERLRRINEYALKARGFLEENERLGARIDELEGLVDNWQAARSAAIAAPLGNPGAWSRLADAESALSATAREAPKRQEAAE